MPGSASNLHKASPGSFISRSFKALSAFGRLRRITATRPWISVIKSSYCIGILLSVIKISWPQWRTWPGGLDAGQDWCRWPLLRCQPFDEADRSTIPSPVQSVSDPVRQRLGTPAPPQPFPYFFFAWLSGIAHGISLCWQHINFRTGSTLCI